MDFFIKVAIITVILFIASILSLQEMDELRERRYNSIFRREFSLIGKKTGPDRKCMAENTGGDSVLDHLSLYPDIDSDWESLLYYCRHRNRPSGCAANLRNRDGPDSLGNFLMLQQKWYQGVMLLGLYLVCYFMREFVEAKLMGKKWGCHLWKH